MKPATVGQGEQSLAEYIAEIRKRLPSDASGYDWLAQLEYTEGRSVEQAAKTVRVLLAISCSDPNEMLRILSGPET